MEFSIVLLAFLFAAVVLFIIAEPVIRDVKKSRLTKRDKRLTAKMRGKERLARNNPHLATLIFP